MILDEPTSALSEAEQERELCSFIARLKARSIGILYISHKLDEIQALSDTVTVLRDGKQVTTLPINELDHARMVELMVGHSITKGAAPAAPQSEITLEVFNLTSRAANIHDVSFAARRGEIIGLAGMLGSGRTELCELLFGIRHSDQGEIRILDKAIQLRTPLDAMDVGIAPRSRGPSQPRNIRWPSDLEKHLACFVPGCFPSSPRLRPREAVEAGRS